MKKTDFRSNLKSITLLLLGSAICALAVNGILVPKQFLSGGLTGITLFINRFVPAAPISWMYLVFNIPLFIFGSDNNRNRWQFFLYFWHWGNLKVL